ncbi:MAG: hypothetical protein KGH71_02665 [Candidatus Micrarchaeota archaeon]|nr:hypothetical protein [Candidatus Micrarchaeota archaeon]
MNFCPKCETKLKIKTQGGEGTNFSCSKCGFNEEKKEELKLIMREDQQKKAQISVVENVKEGRVVVEHNCSKCGCNEAYMGEIPPNRFNDEQSVVVYTCVDCNKTERLQTSGGNGL